MGADTDTRLIKRPDLTGLELAERIALFAVVTKHPRAAVVLGGLTSTAAAAARKLLAESMKWPSGKRQARVTLEFGVRGDQSARLAARMAEAPPVLRLAMFAHLAPQQQARYPKLEGVGFRQVPARAAFAARLVREASR